MIAKLWPLPYQVSKTHVQGKQTEVCVVISYPGTKTLLNKRIGEIDGCSPKSCNNGMCSMAK